MEKSALRSVYRASARKSVCLAALVCVALLTLITWKIDAALAGAGGEGVLRLQLSFTEGTFGAILSSWRSGGVDLMMNTLWLHCIYYAACGVLFSSAMAYFSLLGRGEDWPIGMADLVCFSLPAAGAAAGWVALFLLARIFRGDAASGRLICAESVAASLSWAFFLVSLVLVLRSYFLFRKRQKPGAVQ